jgi:hypothetical protein
VVEQMHTTLDSRVVIDDRWFTLALGLGVLATFPVRVTIGRSARWHGVAARLVQ